MSFDLIQYRLSWINKENESSFVRITDRDTFIPEIEGQQTQEIAMLGADVVCLLRWETESLLKPIVGSAATISFINNSTQNLNFFASGEDNRFQVQVSSGSVLWFGNLVMNEMTEPFLPRGQRVTLVATDNLALLHNYELTDSSGAQLRGRYSFIKFIYECLLKTGYNLDIYVACNLFEDNMDDRTVDAKNCPLEQSTIDSLTFEKDINVFEDCYTVLEKICISWGMRLFQYAGTWRIVRMDEYKAPSGSVSSDMYWTRYVNGVSDSGDNGPNLKTIGHDTDTKFFINADAQLTSQRPFKSIQLQYKLEHPREIVKNISFERGDFSAPLSGVGYSGFTIDDWTLKRGFPDAQIAINAVAYIRRTFDTLGYESSRFVVVSSPSNFDVRQPYIESSEREVCAGDKFEASVDYKFASEITSGSGLYDIMNIVIHGEDDSWWLLGYDDDGNLKWYNTLGWSVFTNRGELSFNFATSEDDTAWRSQSYDSPDIPVTGKMYIWLNGLNESFDSFDDVDMHYSNLRFTYRQKIDGVFAPITGEQYTVSRPENYSAKVEEQLYMADAPCKPYKGSITVRDWEEILVAPNATFLDGNTFALTGDHTAIFTPGRVIRISNTTNNNAVFTVVSSIYEAGVSTTVTTVEGTNFELDADGVTFEGAIEVLSDLWDDWVLKNQIPPVGLGPERFMKWQLFSMWNLLRGHLVNGKLHGLRKIEGSWKGIDSGEVEPVGLWPRYELAHASADTQNKRFVFLSLEMDLFMCQYRGLIHEIDYVLAPRDYEDDFDFKYLF
jgi:hypothetical protein